MERVCYFHAGCPDGFGAAWSVWRAWGEDARYVPRGHDPDPPRRAHVGGTVVFVDIAPDNQYLRQLADEAAHVVVLDHHWSARERYAADPGVENLVVDGGHQVVFDLDYSGAVLAWRHFHPDEPVPPLLAYVQDQDLWQWALPRSAEGNAAIGAHAALGARGPPPGRPAAPPRGGGGADPARAADRDPARAHDRASDRRGRSPRRGRERAAEPQPSRPRAREARRVRPSDRPGVSREGPPRGCVDLLDRRRRRLGDRAPLRRRRPPQ